MNDTYGVMDGLPQACHNIRQPIAEVFALAGGPASAGGCKHRQHHRGVAGSDRDRCEAGGHACDADPAVLLLASMTFAKQNYARGTA